MSELKDLIYGIIALLVIYLIISTHRDEKAIEDKIIELVNDERESVGVAQLNFNTELYDLAKRHSVTMLEENIFEHSKNGVGENIFDSPVYYWTTGCGMTITNNQIAKCMVNGWINSPGHYANIINPEYSITGVGVSCSIFQCKGTQTFMF